MRYPFQDVYGTEISLKLALGGNRRSVNIFCSISVEAAVTRKKGRYIQFKHTNVIGTSLQKSVHRLKRLFSLAFSSYGFVCGFFFAVAIQGSNPLDAA